MDSYLESSMESYMDDRPNSEKDSVSTHANCQKRISQLETELAKVKADANVEALQKNTLYAEWGELRSKVDTLAHMSSQRLHSLKRLEWINIDYRTSVDDLVLVHCCPVCEGAKEMGGHKYDCWLSAEISGMRLASSAEIGGK